MCVFELNNRSPDEKKRRKKRPGVSGENFHAYSPSQSEQTHREWFQVASDFLVPRLKSEIKRRCRGRTHGPDVLVSVGSSDVRSFIFLLFF